MKIDSVCPPLLLAMLALGQAAPTMAQQAAAAIPAGGAASQAGAAPSAAQATQPTDGLDLDSVVVTGTSERKKKLLAPYAISTLNSDKIREQAPRSAVDLLRSLPGDNVENSGGEGGGENVVIRGLPWSGFRLLDLQEDGLPLFESNYERQLQIDELYRVDLNTERVELVRGGTAPIFSNNGAGGVVNFLTNHGTPTPQREIRLTTGPHAMKRADLQLSGPVNDDLQYSVSGFYRESDGLRSTGFDHANQGGQLKMGGRYTFDNGQVFADFKVLNDRSAFYSAIPLRDPRNGSSLDGLIDRHSGGLMSDGFRQVSFLAGDGDGGVRTVQRDLRDGIHPDVKTFTLGGDVDLGGWRLDNKFRHSTGTVGFDAIFNGAPVDAAANLNGMLSRAKSAFAGTSSLRYVLAGGGVAYDPATTAGLVMVNTWSSTRTDYTFTIDDFRASKTLATADWGKHDVTLGLALSRSKLEQQQLGNALLTNVQNQPDALDVQALDSSGKVLGLLTQNGFTSYGSGDLVGDVKARAVSVYAMDSWSITKDWLVDAGVRREVRDEDGHRGVIGSIAGDPSGPLVARSINGLTGELPYSKTQGGTAWTVGTAKQFDAGMNGLARYPSASSMPRFSDQWANINKGVAGTLPNGQPVPVTPIKQAEVGLKYVVPTFQLSLIGFWSRFDNLNASTYVADANGLLSNQPLLINTTTKGIELESAWTPVKAFELAGAVTLQSPKIDSATTFNGAYASSALAGNEIPRTPKTTVSLRPAYLFDTAAGPARLYGTVYSVGRRYQDFVNTSVLSGYTTLDIGLLMPLTRLIEFQFVATNLTNSAGLTEGNARAPVSNALVAQDASVGRPIFGRSFTASLSVKW